MPEKEKFHKLHLLSLNDPDTYEQEFFVIKRKLWKEGSITEEQFPTVELIPIQNQVNYDSHFIYGWFNHIENKKKYYLHIYFVGEEPLHPKIQSIEICELTLESPIDLKTIQLRDEGGFATRPDPTPDEFITITYANPTNSKKRYQRCYG